MSSNEENNLFGYGNDGTNLFGIGGSGRWFSLPLFCLVTSHKKLVPVSEE